MARSDIFPILARIDALAQEINNFVPLDRKSIQFRADLAGLLVVSIAATYESCVKETLMGFAARHHIQFGQFAQNHFRKLNSRISLSDLNSYAKTFDDKFNDRFNSIISNKKERIKTAIGIDFTKSYRQILDWRHDFAHAGVRNTTVEEAMKTHLTAKWVLISFDD